ncbi:CBF/Mak21 family protein [Oesophagostomum dentatum]|uniref:CBF/Mak21 family protein n=1 Tax=Oesophagostomum dentatum TaxID=61180 RepID=A0A0B1TKD5_OESDE|nr:CBF/Mak21 family protein [Oesophagostomum dentatum]
MADMGQPATKKEEATRENPVNREFNKKSKGGSRKPLVVHREVCFDGAFLKVNEVVADVAKDTLGTTELLALEEEADNLLRTDVDLYNNYVRSQGGSEASWLQTVIKTGTASDRMTAMQLQMHSSPVHSLSYIEVMLNSLEKKNTREALELLPILEEIFLNHFLPSNRKLVPFSGRPLKRVNELCSNSENGRKRLLVLWRFEHRLKLVYERFLRAVEGLASLVVEDLSKRALRLALNLLADRPEGERFLLSMLVNKMGHPKPQIGSFVATLLEDLAKRQPNMRPVIVAEVERLIYRMNVSPKAHLYASTFLSQITLRHGDSSLAVQLLSIYFGLFKTLVKRKEPDNRLIGILLSAANRALPFAREKADALAEDVNTLYKVVHTSSYSVSLQTLKLLFQVHQISESLSDRFYTALYRKLLVEVPHSCYNQLLLLLFKVLKSDPSEHRVRSFVKRLLQAATCATPALTAGVLILISRLLESRQGLVITEKQIDRVAIQSAKLGNDDDDEEHFVDIGTDGKPVDVVKKEEVDEPSAQMEEAEKSSLANGIVKSGWVHRKDSGPHSSKSPYNHAARNPLFVDCRNLVDAELLILSKHYHPSVAIFAKALIQDGCINYKGDPIEDFTLLKFLDRFAFKNPKEGRSAKHITDRRLRKKQFDPWGVKKLSISSKHDTLALHKFFQEYISKKPSELPADEHYLHRFASLKFSSGSETEKKNNEDDWEIESVDSAEFDAIIDRFEPGEGNEEFDVDYSKEFTAEKKKPKALKRAAEEETGEDDEIDFGSDEDENEEELDEEEAWPLLSENEDEDEEENSEDDEDVEMESEEDDNERSCTRKNRVNGFGDSDLSDEDTGGNDADAAGEKFASLLEEFEEEEAMTSKKAKRKWKKSKALKRKRI